MRIASVLVPEKTAVGLSVFSCLFSLKSCDCGYTGTTSSFCNTVNIGDIAERSCMERIQIRYHSIREEQMYTEIHSILGYLSTLEREGVRKSEMTITQSTIAHDLCMYMYDDYYLVRDDSAHVRKYVTPWARRVKGGRCQITGIQIRKV